MLRSMEMTFASELCDHYHIDKCCGQQEWESLRSLMQNLKFKDKDARHILRMLSSSKTLCAVYPVLYKFAQIALTVPVSNADNERGFSCMSHVKTKLCNRLTVSSLDTLLRISIEGPETDFDFDSAIQKWSAKQNRRII